MVAHRSSVRTYLLAALGLALMLATPAIAAQPIAADTRIKTLVFNPNEVFTVTTHYGYQSNIEFGAKETIETISVGDRIAWQITPAGRRLFIRAQEENAQTNMTVVTNLRAYQFDLRSSAANAVFGSEQLTYVVRFFYPEDAQAGLLPPPASFSQAPQQPEPLLSQPLRPVAIAAPQPSPPPALRPVPPQATPAPIATTAAAIAAAPPQPVFNYRYTFSGPDYAAPLKIFDDGKSTFFKFPAQAVPQIAVVTARGETLDVPVRRTSDGLIAVGVVAPRFSVRQGADQVLVYNEAGGVL